MLETLKRGDQGCPAPTSRRPKGVVVGLGASAGGLEALGGLFAHMPSDTGATFVVVQHLERSHPSMLAEMLGRHTTMPVAQASDGTRPAPNHVYVIPPNAKLTLERGCLRVMIPDESEPRKPVNALFRSLAEDRGDRAVGIVLSGLLDDGTVGLHAIKEHGGLTLAQSPDTASHPAMPRSAIAAGVVDEVLAVQQMPARLVEHLARLACSVETMTKDTPRDPRSMLARSFERLLLDDFAPCAALTNAQGEILFVEGKTAPYFQIKPGVISSNVFDLVHGNLRLELHAALAAAARTGHAVIRPGVPVDVEGALHRVRLSVRPVPGEALVYAVVVQQTGPLETLDCDDPSALVPDRPALERLERELKSTRAELKQAIEELETAREDHESANEELQSANEEMQSANEELQSSKEEMQSVNEELETVNAELRQKVQELGVVNSDLANFFTSTEVATIFLDRELRIAKFTPSATKLFSLIAGDIGRPLQDLAPRFVGEDLVADGREVLSSLSHIERQVSSPDGKRWFILRAQPYRTIDHRIAGVVVTFVDISDLKAAEEDLTRSREGLRQLAEASLRVMRETDIEAMFQTVSVAALELTGGRAAVTGHRYVDGRFVLGGRARAAGMPDCPPGKEMVIERGGVYMDLMDGTADTVRLTDEQMRAHPRWWGLPEAHVPMNGLLGARLVDRAGGTNGMILVTCKKEGDFTREDESMLRQLGAVASLAAQHVEARVALEEADRSKNQFLAMLSHELRNPLAPIRNSLFVLERAAPGDEQAQRSQAVIARQVAHLTRLVDDLLDVTRVARGKVQLQREVLDFSDVVRRTVEDHRTSFASNRLDLELSIPDEPVFVNADRTRVTQVIGNLLSNAVKFTPSGGRVTVIVEASALDGEAIARVRDTGPGIAQEMLSRVFEPFVQVDATLDRTKGGLGLGLALTKGLVEMHGGTASIESEGLGKGTELTVRFPLEKDRIQAAAPLPVPEERQLRPARRRVLIIDDSVDTAESLREALELSEHCVEIAFSGPQGIEKARTFKPDVVLCDIGLPGMDGYEVARVFRADPALRRVALVALSGYAGPEDVQRAKEAGFELHLAKPPDLQTVEEALTLRTSQASP